MPLRSYLTPAIFVLWILAMAGVYQLMWIARPDYFRVQSGVNFLPISLYQIARDYSAFADGPSLPLPPPQPIEDAATKVLTAYQDFQTAAVALAERRKELAKSSERDKEEYKAFIQSQWAQHDAFIAQKIAPFAEQMEKIDGLMKGILASAGATSAEQLGSGPQAIKYAQLAIDLASAELRKTTEEISARQYAISHLTDFQNQPFQQEYLARFAIHRELEKTVSDQQSSISGLRSALYQAFVHYRDVAIDRLEYGDFLYFSVGAATTATFGDISPNSTLVRMLVCLQVLGSIVFSGLMINGLATRLTNVSVKPVRPASA